MHTENGRMLIVAEHGANWEKWVDRALNSALSVEVIVRHANERFVNFALRGRVLADGTRLDGDEAIRTWILRSAGMAIVPFGAFGVVEDTGWFRLSVGAVSLAQIAAVLPRLRAALQAS